MDISHSGERLRQHASGRGLTATQLAQDLGIGPQSLNNWFNRGVPAREQYRVCNTLGLRYEWLVNGAGEPFAADLAQEHPDLTPISVWDDDTPLDDDEVYVPFLKEVELSAGAGKTAVEQSNQQKLRFGKITLRRQGIQANEAVCVTVTGNSMEPVLPDGSTVGVNRGAVSVIDGKMYALNHDGQLRVKTLYRLPGGGIRLRSFNRDEHADEEYTLEEMRAQEIFVIGRVFWSSVLW